MRKKQSAGGKIQWSKMLKKLSPYTIQKGFRYLKHYGPKEFWIRLHERFEPEEVPYGPWYAAYVPDEETLEKQRKHKFNYAPLISIAVPAYQTPVEFLKQMIESLISQTYTEWELCIANASPDNEEMQRVLADYSAKDVRVRFCNLKENLGIAENTNRAFAMAKGEFMGLLDHDDLLAPNALYEIVNALQDHPQADALYTDEDKVTTDLDEHFQPHLKPDFNLDLLRSNNYICHFFVVHRSIVEKAGGFRKEFDGAQDYDFIFRCTEKAKEIVHIPKVLYHWRCHQDSTASNPQSKLYAFEAGSRAIMEHYHRMGIEAEKVEKGVDYGIYHTTFKIKDNPLVSVIIPNKDHRQDLDLCIRSMITRGTYKNLEFVVIENNSTDPETFAYYEAIQKEFPQVRVVTWTREFNYSAINNFGVQAAKGQYLLFLNNDTELIAENFVEEMLGFCQREDVGAVGARLLYQDDTIQHAGVVIGFGGVAGHTFIGLHKAENSYFHRAMCAQDYSAVTAACMMSKKSVFDAVGGFSEDLAVAFNDIDYCMKVRSLGKLVVYAPYALLYHYESKSRGLEDTPEKVARFNREVAKFAKKWPEILKNGDPYYNPNLTLRKSNFALRDLKKEGIGQPYELDPAIRELMKEAPEQETTSEAQKG